MTLESTWGLRGGATAGAGIRLLPHYQRGKELWSQISAV